MSAFGEKPDTPVCAIDDMPLPGEAERLATQFTSWYPILSEFTMKSRTIVLSDAFLEYLKEDGIMLPKSAQGALGHDQLSDDEDEGLREAGGGRRHGTHASGDDADNDDEDDEAAPAVHDFPELDAQISQALADLGGTVFPKLNWSCPLDAAWMNAGSLKCYSLADVYVLLKASDRVMWDVECMLQGTGRDKNRPDCVTLVLRKWANLLPSMEFRVFVQHNSIVGMCQRDCSTFYDFLAQESETEAIAELLEAFCRANLLLRLPLESFAADLFVDKKKRVWVVDVNVFGPPTSALLFDWPELCVDAAAGGRGCPSSTAPDCGAPPLYEFRVVQSSAGVLPSEAAQSKGPIDVTLAPDFHRFMEICKAQRREGEGGGGGGGNA